MRSRNFTIGKGMVAGVLVALVASSCSSTPDLVGVWEADDGSGVKTINEDGSCAGMYYNNGEPLDIGGGMTCLLGSEAVDGRFTLVVQQPPNQAEYAVTFEGDDVALLDVGETTIRLTRR